MYKTPKGIEYGVGTKFNTARDTKPWLEITKITDKTVHWSKIGDEREWCSYDFQGFNSMLDNNAWTIIQDTQNNQMEEKIEVGDTVHSKMFPGTDHVIKSIDGKILWFESGSWLSVDAVNLVSKANKQEIVGYELLKDLPGIPKGATTHEVGANPSGWYFKQYFFNTQQLQDTTWFKPIYKAKEVVVKISKGREVKFSANSVLLMGNESLYTYQIETIHDFIISNKNVGGYKVEVTKFRIGCQEFTKEDIESVYQAIQNLK